MKEKAIIVKVGTFENGQPKDFELDCRGVVPAMDISETGEILYGGYTLKELQEIAEDESILR